MGRKDQNEALAEIEMPGVEGNFPATPEKMDNEALASLVEGGVKKLRDYLEAFRPYIEELKARFVVLPRDKTNRGKSTIAGCRTWKEFCEQRLGRTDSAIRKAWAVAHKVEKPKLLLPALMQLLPMAERETPIVRFAVAKNGNVLIATGCEAFGEASDILPVRAPKGCTSEYPGYDKTNYKYALATFTRNAWELSADAPDDDAPIEAFAPPFEFTCHMRPMMDFLKDCDGDPFIVTRGPGWPVFMYETDHGQLRIERDVTGFIENAITRRTMAQRAALEQAALEAQRAKAAAQPYTGDFLPDLKVGDEVTIAADTDEILIEEVATLSGIEITTTFHSFDREGIAAPFRILRIATEEDHFRVAEVRFREEEEKAQETAARQNEARAEKELKDKRAEILAKAKALLEGTKIRLHSEYDPWFNRSSLLLRIEANVTLEELEKLADALEESPVSVAGKIPATLDPAPDPEG